MNARKLCIIRLALSLLFGIAVASVPLHLILGGAQTNSTLSFQSRITDIYLKKLDRIAQFAYQTTGVYPTKLADLREVPRDGWSRPFLYSLSDGKPLVESLGRDGKRGGVGLDADLSNLNPNPPQARIPFWARLFEREAQGIVLASLSCGIMAGALFFAGVRHQTFSSKTLPVLAISLLLSLALAAFGALTIATFHIPSGH